MNTIYNTSTALKKLNLSYQQIDMINSIEFEESKRQWLITKIQQYITHGYPLNILVENYDKILLLGRDSSSIKSYIIRFGELMGMELFNKKTKSTTVNKERLILTFGEERANQIGYKKSACIDAYIERYGIETGTQKWNEYLKNRKATYQKKRDNGHVYPKYNLDYYKNLHGDVAGSEVYLKKINSQRYKVSKHYYIEQYGPIDGPIRCRENKDHCSIGYFIKKFGEIDGHIKYDEHKHKMRKVASKKTYSYYSEMSYMFFNSIKETITDLHYYGPNELKWAVKPNEWINQALVCPDLFYNGKIVEFNGDVFHGNPSLFLDEDCPHPFQKTITAKQLQELDKNRYNYFNNLGYEILVIWENDFNNNNKEEIKKCIQFLMNK